MLCRTMRTSPECLSTPKIRRREEGRNRLTSRYMTAAMAMTSTRKLRALDRNIALRLMQQVRQLQGDGIDGSERFLVPGSGFRVPGSGFRGKDIRTRNSEPETRNSERSSPAA